MMLDGQDIKVCLTGVFGGGGTQKYVTLINYETICHILGKKK